MRETSQRALVIACIVLFVFPTSVIVVSFLFTLPVSVLLSLALGPSRGLTIATQCAGYVVGILGAIWIARFAWPRRREGERNLAGRVEGGN